MSIIRTASIMAAMLCAGAAGAQKPTTHAKPATTAGAHDTTKHDATKATTKEHAGASAKDSSAHARSKSVSKKPTM